jgi:hypothetical protein
VKRPNARTWLEVPAVSGTTAAARLKYPARGDALVIYRGAKAYLSSEDRSLREELLRHADVRTLSASESDEFEGGLPFAAFGGFRHEDSAVRLGDAVHAITARLGIASCAGCRRRRRALNNVVIWGWWRRAKHAAP